MKTMLISSIGALATVLTLTSAAFGQSAPSGVYLRDVVHAGTGCPAGSAQVNYRNGDLLVDLYGFVAETGAGVPISASRKNCQISIDLRVPAGWQYSVRSATYRGFVRLDSGVTATQTTSYYFQGQARSPALNTTFRGPENRDFQLTDTLTSTLWSPCDANRALNINVQANVRGSRGADGLIGLDSPFNLSHDVRLAWRRCP